MKKTMKDVPVGTTITVKRITGGRKVVLQLEEKGIMAGSDVTMVALLPEAGICRVAIDRGEREFSMELADCILVEKQYVRTTEPILLGGCCASGDTSGILERMEKAAQEMEERNKRITTSPS